MSKTLLWVVVGIVAVAGLSAVAFMQFGPRGELAASTVPASTVPTAASISQSATASASSEGDAPVAAFADSKGDASTIAVAVPVLATASDSGVAVAQPPAAAPSATPTVDELIQSQALYEGQSIALRGTILTQCTAGCEFALDDGTGVLSVQLEGKGKDRLIPLGKVGKKIEVHGVFHSDPRPQIVIEDPNGWQFVK